MTAKHYQGVYIAGCGQTKYEKKTDKPVQRVLWEASQAALDSAGLSWKAVDGLAITSFMLPPDNATVIAEHFGIQARWLFHGVYGGASSIIGMMHAARAIQAGDVDVVVCAAADVFDVSTHNEMIDRSFNAPLRDYMAPFGFGGANVGRRPAEKKRAGRGEGFSRARRPLPPPFAPPPHPHDHTPKPLILH